MSGGAAADAPAREPLEPRRERGADVPATGPLATRAACTSGSPPGRTPIARETPAPPSDLPLAEPLAKALEVLRAARAQVESIFAGVREGRAVPLSVAEGTVDALLTGLERHPEAAVSLMRLKTHDDYACMHSVAVCALMACLARQMGLDRKQRVQAALAGLLHDIGKAFVPARILAKPGRLTAEEMAIVRAHPRQGFEALELAGGVADTVKDVARHHHERPDGVGYPDGLRGDGIRLLARMGAVCDVYDAVTSNRPYKDGWDPASAMQAMLQWSEGGQFDHKVTVAFHALMGEWPIGSLVRLRSERLGVVSARDGNARVATFVTAFYCLRSRRSVSPEVVALGKTAGADAVVGVESNRHWRFEELEKLWAGDCAERVRGR